jgi:hypothetical protein
MDDKLSMKSAVDQKALKKVSKIDSQIADAVIRHADHIKNKVLLRKKSAKKSGAMENLATMGKSDLV